MNLNNKKILIGFVIIFILGLNVYNIPLKGQDSQTVITESSQYETAKAFDPSKLNKILNDSLATPVDFKSYNKVIVSFWATWCPSCRLENTIFNKIIDNYKNELLIIGVSVDKSKELTYVYPKYVISNRSNNPKIKQFDDILVANALYY